MSLLLGCSELQETKRLFEALLNPKSEQQNSSRAVAEYEIPVKLEPAPEAEAAVEKPPLLMYRGDRLEYVLSTMCRRGGLNGAVVADAKGLPLAVYNSPADGDVLAAFTSVLGNALERAGTLLGERGAEMISMDINHIDKIVLRRFRIDGDQYFFLVICSQELDGRTEVELSIEQITAVLTEN